MVRKRASSLSLSLSRTPPYALEEVVELDLKLRDFRGREVGAHEQGGQFGEESEQVFGAVDLRPPRQFRESCAVRQSDSRYLATHSLSLERVLKTQPRSPRTRFERISRSSSEERASRPLCIKFRYGKLFQISRSYVTLPSDARGRWSLGRRRRRRRGPGPPPAWFVSFLVSQQVSRVFFLVIATLF